MIILLNSIALLVMTTFLKQGVIFRVMNSKSVLDDKNGIPVLRRKTSLPIKLDEGNATIRGLSHIT